MVDKEVADFYDDFSEFQESIAYNERHFLMLDKLLELGMDRSSKVLELGCGIGIISSLILRVLREGELCAADISPKSIKIAQENNRERGNVEFHVADVTKFEPGKEGFDFVTLFDVLEHVPVEGHRELFGRIAKYLSESGKLIINIPNPDYLQYIHETYPERLQIIDQPLSIPRLIEDATTHGFRLRFYENYNLWRKYESVFMWFEPEPEFKEIETEPPVQTIMRRLQNKFEIY